MQKLTLQLYTIFTNITLALLGFLDTREIIGCSFWLALVEQKLWIITIMDYYTLQVPP